jgi:uncharacterized protein (DUF1697 family)
VAQFVALLRAVNVAGHRGLAMADLRRVLEELAFSEAKTLLQSGNAVFATDGQTSTAELEALIEAELTSRLGLRTDVLVRSPEDMAALVRDNPFPAEARDDPGRLVVTFLKVSVSLAAVEALQSQVRGPELVRPHGRELYITYPDGMGRSRLTGAVIESKLGTKGTARNWNTVLKLAAAVGV